MFPGLTYTDHKYGFIVVKDANNDIITGQANDLAQIRPGRLNIIAALAEQCPSGVSIADRWRAPAFNYTTIRVIKASVLSHPPYRF